MKKILTALTVHSVLRLARRSRPTLRLAGTLALQIVWAAHAQTLDTTGFGYSMQIAFPNCGIADTSPLADFPAAVVLDHTSDPGLAITRFAANGADLRFADDAGNLLAHEVDTWNNNGLTLVWVRVPSFHEDAVITAYWNHPAPPAGLPASDTWSADYANVWHLNGNALPLPNSVAGASPLTEAGALAGHTAPALGGMDAERGGFVSFSGTGGHLRTDPNPVYVRTSALTLEALVWDDSLSGNLASVVAKRDGSGSAVYFLYKNSGAGRVYDFEARTAGGTQRPNLGTVPPGQWAHVGVVYDGLIASGNRVFFYADGVHTVSGGNGVSGLLNASGERYHVGALDSVNAYSWAGKIGEVRVSSTARSAAWMKASAASIKNPAAFALCAAPVEITPGAPRLVAGAPVVTPAGVELSAALESPSVATVTLYWGETDAGTSALWANTNAAPNVADGQAVTNKLLHATLPHLFLAQQYNFRWHAQNAATNAWTGGNTFTTWGAPVLGTPSGATLGTSATFAVPLLDPGAVAPLVTCHVGLAPNALAPAASWQNDGLATTYTFATNGLPPGATLHYAFTAESTMTDAGLNHCLVSTATNSVFVDPVTTWQAIGASTDWSDPANWDNGVPGPGAFANFHFPGALVTATNDLAASTALFNAAGSVHLDLGGNALAVPQGLFVGANAAPGYAAQGGAAAVFTNAVLDLVGAALDIGATANNSLTLLGSQLLAGKIRVGTGAAISGNALHLRGAAMTNHSVNVGAVSQSYRNLFAIEDSFVEAVHEIFTGREWNANFNTNTITRSRVIVRNTHDGQGGYMLGSNNSHNNVSIIRDSYLQSNGYFSFGYSDNNLMRIIRDGAGAECEVVGASTHFGGDKNNKMIIEGGATFRATGGIGFSSNFTLHNTNSTVRAASDVTFNVWATNARVFLTGPDARFHARGLYYIDRWDALNTAKYNQSSGNGITLQGGQALIAEALVIAGKHDGPGNGIAFTAPADYLETSTFETHPGTHLEYTLPAAGFDRNHATGASPFTVKNNALLDPSTRFTITAPDFTGRAVLMNSANGAITVKGGGDLPLANFSFDLPRNHIGKVRQTPTFIEITISPTPTLFMVR